MKRLLVLLLGIWGTAAAQMLQPVVIDFEPGPDSARIALPFASVKVWDVRFDRSNVGVAYKSVKANGERLAKTTAVFPEAFDRHFPKIVNNLVSFDANSEDTLLLLVKQFRFSDFFYNSMNRQLEPASLLKVSLSFFRLRQNQLTKLFGVDDLLADKWRDEQRFDKESLNESRIVSFQRLLRSLFERRNWQAGGPSFDLAGVKESLPKRFTLPVLTDSVLVAGIYANFDEFRDNRPSLTKVKFNYRKERVQSAEDPKGNRILFRKMWGLCDGKKRYIVFHGELCELIPSDKSFCFRSFVETNDLAGARNYDNVYPMPGGLLAAPLLSANDGWVNRQYFYLNMDEKEVYLEEIFGRSKMAQMHREILK